MESRLKVKQRYHKSKETVLFCAQEFAFGDPWKSPSSRKLSQAPLNALERQHEVLSSGSPPLSLSLRRCRVASRSFGRVATRRDAPRTWHNVKGKRARTRAEFRHEVSLTRLLRPLKCDDVIYDDKVIVSRRQEIPSRSDSYGGGARGGSAEGRGE